MDICATFRMTEREYRSAMRNSPAFRGVMIISALVLVVGLVILPSNGPTIVLYVGLCLPVFMEVIIRKAVRSTAAQFAEPWLVRVTDETFTQRTAVSQTETSWNAYNAAWERSGFWYLRQIGGVTYSIPKRALDAAQKAGLAEFFARQLPPPKIHWYNPLSWR
jgi:hypothetical protein